LLHARSENYIEIDFKNKKQKQSVYSRKSDLYLWGEAFFLGERTNGLADLGLLEIGLLGIGVTGAGLIAMDLFWLLEIG